VELQVEVRHRPSSPVESTAYFVVAEALTNVARHAQATRAWVAIVRVGDKLIVEIRDDGRGGAEEALGTGLTGLRDRVASVGGTMQVMSPPGGPTTLLVEMPCG
jgi:signal transduction histidine kinase